MVAPPWWAMRLVRSMRLPAKDSAWPFDRQIALQRLSPPAISRNMTQAIAGSDGSRVVGAPAYGEYAQSIRESGAHLLALIEDLLDLSRAELSDDDLARLSQLIDEARAEGR